VGDRPKGGPIGRMEGFQFYAGCPLREEKTPLRLENGKLRGEHNKKKKGFVCCQGRRPPSVEKKKTWRVFCLRNTEETPALKLGFVFGVRRCCRCGGEWGGGGERGLSGGGDGSEEGGLVMGGVGGEVQGGGGWVGWREGSVLGGGGGRVGVEGRGGGVFRGREGGGRGGGIAWGCKKIKGGGREKV